MRHAVVFSALGSRTGCALRAEYLAKGLRANDWNAEVVLPGFRYLPMSLEALLSIPMFVLKALFSRATLAVGIKPFPNVWLALWILKLKGCRAVMDVDDLDGAYRGGLAAGLLTAAQRPSFWLLENFSTHHPLLKERLSQMLPAASRLVTLGQGVDCDTFKAPSRAPGGSGLFFGAHLNIACQLETLMLWLGPFLKRKPDTVLVIGGGGPMLERWQRRYAGPQVKFSGYQNTAGMAKLISKSAVCLSAYADEPGNTWRVPMKAGEYLAMGRPVVTNFIPGLAMFRQFLYLADSPETFRKNIERLLKGHGDGREKRGRIFVRKELNLKKNVKNFLGQLA